MTFQGQNDFYSHSVIFIFTALLFPQPNLTGINIITT